MGLFFSANELLDIAIGLERQGLAFYQARAEREGKPQTREVFRQLAEMERKHWQTFEEMRGSLAGLPPLQPPSEEYQLYLRALAESILFYSEMRELVHQPRHEVLEQLIEDERAHLKQLTELKQGLISPK